MSLVRTLGAEQGQMLVSEFMPIASILFGCGVACVAVIARMHLQQERMRQEDPVRDGGSVHEGLDSLRRRMAKLRETTTASASSMPH